MVKTIAEERKKRSTAGTRMSSLVGKAVEDDSAFWSHSTWAEEKGDLSDDGSFHESDEESDAKVDKFDSDFDDSEGEEEEVDGEEELIKEERRAKRAAGKKKMNDIVDAGRELMQKKKNAAQRKKNIRGSDLNSGLVLNLPGVAPISQNKGVIEVAPVPVTAPAPASAPIPAPAPLQAKSAELVFPGIIRKSSRAKISKFSVSEMAGKRSLRTSTLNNAIAASTATVSTRQQPQQSAKSKHKRKYTQEELLLEAVSNTEAENQRWILNRKRLQVEENSKAELNKKGHHGGNKKVISKFNSRRGCLNTLTFPEMDHVPEVFTRAKTSEEQRIQIVEKMRKDNTCVITGKKARYRDPKTNLGYHDLAAYKELCRRSDAGDALGQKEISSKGQKPRVSNQSSEVSAVPSQQHVSVPQLSSDIVIDKVSLPLITQTKVVGILPPSSVSAAAPQPTSSSTGQETNEKLQVPQQKDKKHQSERRLESKQMKPSTKKGPNDKQSAKSKAEPKTIPSSSTVEKRLKAETIIVGNAKPLDNPSKQNPSTALQSAGKASGMTHNNSLEEKEEKKRTTEAVKEKTASIKRKQSDLKSSDGPPSSKRKVKSGVKTKSAETTNDASNAAAEPSLVIGDISKQPPNVEQNSVIAASLGRHTISSLEAIGKIELSSEIPSNIIAGEVGQPCISSSQTSSNDQMKMNMQAEEMNKIGHPSQPPHKTATRNVGQSSILSLQSLNNEQLMMNMQLNALNQMNGMGMQYSAYNPMNTNNVGLMNNAAMMTIGNNNNNGMFQYPAGNQMTQYQQMLTQPPMDVTSMLAMSLGQQGGMPMQPTSQQQQQEQLIQRNRELQLMNQLYAANPEYSSDRQQPPGSQRNNGKNQNGQWPNGL